MKLPRSAAHLGVAAGLLGGLTGLAVASGLAPSPATFRLASHDDGPGDISGPCDEAEHAGDPRCAGADAGLGRPGSPTTTVGDGAPVPGPGAGATSAGVLDAAGAGTVRYTVGATSLTLIDALPAAGWQVEVEQAAGRELEVDFRSGTRRVQVNVELEDGQVRERVRVRDAADGSETRLENGQVVRQEPGDDDRSGPSGDDADDRSGPGGGDDDAGDDRSGSSSDDDLGDDRSGSSSDDDHDDDRSSSGGDDHHDDDSSGPGGDDDHDDD